MAKPNVNLEGQKELDKVEQQFDDYKDQVDSLTKDRMDLSRKADVEPIHKIANKDLDKNSAYILKPSKTVRSSEKFNEKFRKPYEEDCQRLDFTAEHRELIGETIEMWTKPYPGMNCEYWEVPTGKKVNAPRYVFEKLQRTGYHRLRMDESIKVGTNQAGTMYGQIVVDNYVPRMDAFVVPVKRNVYMGAR